MIERKLLKQKVVLKFIFKVLFISLLFGGIFFAAFKEGTITADTSHLLLNEEAYADQHMVSLWDKFVVRVQTQPFNIVALIIFVLAMIHTLFSHFFTDLSKWLIKKNSEKTGVYSETFLSEICHFLGEVEVIFAIWVIPLAIAMTYFFDWQTTIDYLNDRDYTEPMFVVVIMALASTNPVMKMAENLLRWTAKLGKDSVKAWWWSILTIAPLLGSFITEPGAMTIAAILLGHQFYRYKPSVQFAYATLGLLFTNISVGGVFTNFAAPPVLMVNKVWGWSTPYMFEHFGTRAFLGIILANMVYFIIFRKEFARMELEHQNYKNDHTEKEKKIPLWITLTHVLFLAWIVVHVHYPIIFLGSFMLFLGFHRATRMYQTELELKTPVLVGLFLAGLVVHGGLQAWWITPLLSNAGESTLFFLSAGLTAFNDNAEVTFLATLIPSFAETMKHAVVAGAVTGGGLTLIANAPNPAGGAILGEHFKHGISFSGLFLGAIIPTCLVGGCFYFFNCC